jgi:hypothetical protein
MEIDDSAIVDPAFVGAIGCRKRAAMPVDHSEPFTLQSNVDPAVRGRQVYGQTEFGGIQAKITRVNSKDSGSQEARRPALGAHGIFTGDLRTIFRKSSDVRVETSRTSSKTSRDSPKSRTLRHSRSSSFRAIFSCLGRSSFRGSSQDLSSLRARRSSLDMQSARSGPRHSFDEPCAFGQRYRRMSTEAAQKDSSDMGYVRRPRRNSVDSREVDDRGFLDRAFENAIGIDFSDEENNHE